ncbi:hypothetical protein [Vibrio sp. Hal054]|uniref:hypothetical protein n=1 Tax=Vibrio sp. Hal054 TaxID=3035158 RepID=UPI00301BBA29
MANGEMFVMIPLRGRNNRYEQREFNGRLSLDLALHCIENDFSIICLDRVNVDDLKFYLHNRNARTLNVPAIKAIKEAIAIKEAEYVEELPIRTRLYAALQAGNVATGTDALKLISDAVAVFRCANKGAKLTIVNGDTNKYNQLLDQLFVLSGKAGDATQDVRLAEEQLGRTVIRITVDTKGVYVAYSTALAHERDDRLTSFKWVARTRYRLAAKGPKALKTTFAKLHARPANESIQYEIDNYDDYVFPADHPWNTPNAKSKQFEYPVTPSKQLASIEDARASDQTFESLLSNYSCVRESHSRSQVEEPVCLIPLATVLSKNSSLGTLCLIVHSVPLLTYLANGCDHRLAQARHVYSDFYQQSVRASEKFTEAIEKHKNMSLVEMSELRLVDDASVFTSDGLWVPNGHWRRVERCEGKLYSIQEILDRRTQSYKLLDGIDGSVDHFLKITPPADFSPCAIKHFDGFRSEWNGYALFELTDDLLKAVNSREVSMSHIFDTRREAEDFMVNHFVKEMRHEGFTEVPYVESTTLPSDITIRGGASFKPIKAWRQSNRD